MNILDALTNMAGGGLIGSVLHIASSFADTWRKKKEAEVEIMVMNAKVAAAEKEAAWNAFAKSQEGANSTLKELPASTSPWVVNCFVLGDAASKWVRPTLCLLSVLLIFTIFFMATPEQRYAMFNEIQFGAWTVIFWYFGARYSRK